MKRIRTRRPSAAMVVAVVALFVAMGGVGYAAATIGSAQVKNNSLRGKDIRNGTLKGADVNESSLGKVPSAGQADSAQSAESATSAQSAQTAVSAQSAANAGTLDGIDSIGFLRSGTRSRTVSDTVEDANYGDDANLAQLSNLEGGRWTIAAKLQVDNDGGAAETIDCDLVKNNGGLVQLDSSLQTLGANGAAAQVLNYILIGETTAIAAGTDDLFLRCEQLGADNDADEMRIVAHKVD